MSGLRVSHKQPHHVSLRLLVIVVVAVFLVVVATAGFFAMQFFSLKSEGTDDETTKRVVSKVESLYVLPEGEPTVAKVQDKEKLAQQSFFSQAKNGDYVLIYSDAKLALLYREEINKLVNVGPIALGDETQLGTTPATN